MDWLQVVLAMAVFALSFMWFKTRRPSYLPPGPRGLPLVGCLPYLKNSMHVSLRDIGRKYGSLYTIPLGIQWVIVLNDWKSIKEALLVQTENFCGRPETLIFDEIRQRTDITGSDGPEWKQKRTYTMKTLRSLGFRDVFMEAIIMAEVEKMIANLKLNNNNKKTLFDDLFFLYLLNIVWSIAAGRKFELDDESNNEFAQALKDISVQNSNSNVLQFLPYLKYIPSMSREFRAFVKTHHKVCHYLEDEVDEHIQRYQEGNVNDFVDAYIDEMFKEKKLGKDPPLFHRKFLIGILYNLFNGGVDTGNNTLTWAFLYLATYPEVQRKVQEELDRVIGRSRLPTWADRVNLPYTEAVVCELQRVSTIAPLGFPHCAYRTTKVCGYTVPKGMYVLANLWAVHNDPDVWGDPENFRPERFLNEKGLCEKPEYLVPFSVGRRICIGEALARMEQHLFIPCLLHQFSFSLPPGDPIPSFEPIMGLTLRPHPFSLIIRQRDQ